VFISEGREECSILRGNKSSQRRYRERKKYWADYRPEMTPRSKSYQENLLKALEDPFEAQAYLNAALEDDNPDVFLLALKDVAEAKLGGMKQLADETKEPRKPLPDTF